MTLDELIAFAEEAFPAFAIDKVAAGQWTADEALELSRKSFEEATHCRKKGLDLTG
jgi:hypothetical protein